MIDCDVAVIGAGVVGLACAARLARGGLGVVAIERHESFGRETSSRNSQVVHAGIYYPAGSWKARLSVRGNASLRAWCATHGVALSPVGKHVVALDHEDEASLDALLERARDNGVPGVARISASELAVREPAVRARGALFVPSSAIVDAHALMASLLAEARAHGADFAWRHWLARVEHDGRTFALEVGSDSGQRTALRARAVVNAAGLLADDVAALAGIDVDAAGYRQRWVKGRYFRLRGRDLVRSLIYPVPPRDLAGLGVHLTLELDGAMRLGPDVVPLAERREDYDVPEDAAETFFASASRYLRGIARADLSPDQAGIRPKLAPHLPGEPRDFVIAEESARGLPGWVDLIGIESPGLTCALEIADEVAALLDA